MVWISFKIGCYTCKKSDGLTHLISWEVDEEEEEDIESEDVDEPEFQEDYKQLFEEINDIYKMSKGQIQDMLDGVYEDMEYICPLCGAKEMFDFFDIELDGVPVKKQSWES